MQIRAIKRLLLLSCAIIFANKTFAVNVDYNVNGYTDFHLYGIGENKVNIDHGFFLDNKQAIGLTLGNSKNEKIALGDYDGDNRCDIGIVRKKNGNVVWKYRSLSSQETTSGVNFGTGKIRVITGCDFNGTGRTDLAYIDGKTLYFKDFNGKKKKIELPRSDYQYVYCADVTGNGKDEFIGKKKGIGFLNGKKTKNVWAYDVVNRKSKILANKKAFGYQAQGNIISHDINQDGKQEIGFVTKSGDYSFLVFLKSLNGNEIHRAILPREIKKTNGKFDINRAYFDDGIGFIYKGVDGNVYKYNMTHNVDTTFILSVDTPRNIKVGTLARDVDDFVINAGSGGGNNGGGNGDITKVSCDVVRGTGNGFLWKARGDAYGGVSVAVLPIHTKASSCHVVAGDNSKTETLWCSSQSANPYNGVGRQHWRARSLCSAFKKPSVLKCQVGSQWQCWKLENPCQARIE